MSPRHEREAAMDDMAAYAERFGRSHIPDSRAPTRVVPAHVASRTDTTAFSPLALTTSELLAEVDALALRTARHETTARDVMLVHALAARLRSLTMRPATNREPLDSALWLDLRTPEAA